MDTTASTPAASQSAAPTQPTAASAAPAARVEVSALFAPGQAPQRGTPAYATAVMAAGLIDAGHMSVDDARFQLANQTGADPAQPNGEPANELGTAAHAVKTGIEVSGALQSLPELPLDAPTASFYGKAIDAALRRPPVSDAQNAAQATSVRQYMENMHGRDGAAKLIADAQAEVVHLEATAIPNIRELLERTGGGNDPFLIARLAERQVKRAQQRMLKGLKR